MQQISNYIFFKHINQILKEMSLWKFMQVYLTSDFTIPKKALRNIWLQNSKLTCVWLIILVKWLTPLHSIQSVQLYK